MNEKKKFRVRKKLTVTVVSVAALVGVWFSGAEIDWRIMLAAGAIISSYLTGQGFADAGQYLGEFLNEVASQTKQRQKDEE